MVKPMLRITWLFGIGLALSVPLSSAFQVLQAAPFYQGKVLTVIQGRTAGGLRDLRVRAAAPYLQKYLPGNPQIVFQYMSGAGGIQAANHMAGLAKNDGLTIANIATSLFIKAISNDPVVRYSLSDFIFLGAPSVGGPYALVVRPLGLDRVEKLKAYKRLRIDLEETRVASAQFAHTVVWLRARMVVRGRSGGWQACYSGPLL